jgi:HTH-type transcriptional regulator / antitoxin HipB
MVQEAKKLPSGNVQENLPLVIRSSEALGSLLRERRKHLALTQAAVAGIGNTGNRFIVDLESGKPTVQLQKVLETMDILGLELVVRRKSTAGP